MNRPIKAGAEFEDLVISLLRSSTGKRVGREQILGHKKVDGILEDERYGSRWITLIECKDHQRPLTLKQLNGIWVDYLPILESGAAHELLVVTRVPAAPAAQAFARTNPRLNLQDISGFIAGLLDVRGYLQDLIDGYRDSADGLPHYFMTPSLTQRGDALAVLRDWVKGRGELDPRRPIALLGAYGLGKSSLATRFAHDLAQNAMEDPSEPIPILIRLGELGGASDVRALLGKHFTDTHQVRGYNYRFFSELNSAGRLVVILDGFDEMRQLLSRRELSYNMNELARLYHPASRLMILGRPTVFETDEEMKRSLHGVYNRRGVEMVDPGALDYQELELAPLAKPQIREFVSRYLEWRWDAVERPTRKSARDIARVIDVVESQHFIDLSQRPVQLRMLATILPSYHGDVEDLDVAQLYYIFIDHLIDEVGEREETKISRLAFSHSQRREFLQAFAYWHWTQSKSQIVTTDQIPLELVEPFVLGDVEAETVRRDMVAGAPLDRRPGERVRFAHLSFQEFLVAQELWDRLVSEKMTLAEVDDQLSRDVAAFMRELQTAETRRAMRKTLAHFSGPVSLRCMRACFDDAELQAQLRDELPDQAHISPWELLVLGESSLAARFREAPWVSAAVVKATETAAKPDGVLVAMFFLLRYWDSVPNPDRLLGRQFELLLQSHRTDERFTNAQLAKSKVEILHPLLGGRYVGDLRVGQERIGEIRGSTTLTKAKRGNLHIFRESEQGRVSWFPRETLDLAERLHSTAGTAIRAARGKASYPPPRGGRSRGTAESPVARFGADLRKLRPLFNGILRETACLSEWLVDGSVAPDLALTGEANGMLDLSIAEALQSLQASRLEYRQLQGELSRRRRAGALIEAGHDSEDWETELPKKARRRE